MILRGAQEAEAMKRIDSIPDGMTADDPIFVAALDHRIAEMRRLLKAMAPGSTTLALNALRDAYPDTSLDERVQALSKFGD